MSRVAVARARASAAGVSPERSERCEAMSLEVCSMQRVRLHALAQLAYEGIVEDLNADGGTATNATLRLPSSRVTGQALLSYNSIDNW